MTRVETRPTPGAPQPIGGTSLILIALGIGLIAVIANYIYIEQRTRETQPKYTTWYHLNRNVQPGEKLGEKDYGSFQVPITRETGRAADVMGLIVDQQVSTKTDKPLLRPASINELLTEKLFTQPEMGSGDDKIRQGQRGVALPVYRQSVPPILRWNDRVDIAAPFVTGGRTPQLLLVMENVPVVAVGTQSSGDAARSSAFDTITIEVSFEEALALSEIKRVTAGPFEIYLRNRADKAIRVITRGGVNPAVTALIPKLRATAPPLPPVPPDPGGN